MESNKRIVNVLYRNYRGEIRVRTILPLSKWFGTTQWHPAEQWFEKVLDIETNEERDFACNDILAWGDSEIFRHQLIRTAVMQLRETIQRGE